MEQVQRREDLRTLWRITKKDVGKNKDKVRKEEYRFCIRI